VPDTLPRSNGMNIYCTTFIDIKSALWHRYGAEVKMSVFVGEEICEGEKDTSMEDAEKTILIIDDDLDFHTLVGGVLRKAGYKVRSLFEGKVNQVFSLITTCDMVLLDIELPGVDGVEVGKRLKSDPSTRNIPIIMITGHTEGEKLFREAEANDFIQKPFQLSGLLTKITEGLRSATRGAA
jgi:response regulator RpfG family c-di-GMP phosphodiesterase